MYSADEFAPIVEEYQALVWAIAFGYTGDEATAEDITQEVFLVAWRRMDDVAEPDKLRPFLSGIARNLARNARRKRLTRHSILAHTEIEDRAPTPLDLSLVREDERLVSEALVALDPESREALLLYYMEEQSAAEVANRLGVSQPAVRQRLTRARRALRAGVEKLVEGRVGGRRVAVVAAVLAAMGGGAQSAVAGAAGGGKSLGVGGGKSLAIAAGAAAALVLAAVAMDRVMERRNDGATERRNDGAVGREGDETAERGGDEMTEGWEESLAEESGEEAMGEGDDEDVARRWADQPLVTGRVRSEYPEADVDGDGELSEDELAVLREMADDVVQDAIATSLQEDVSVLCHAISLDQTTGVHETLEFYPMDELRAQIAAWSEEGLDLSDREAIASVVATRGGPDRVCAPLNVIPSSDMRDRPVLLDVVKAHHKEGAVFAYVE